MTLCSRLWRDERGSMEAMGLMLIYTIIVFGAVTGIVALRNQIVQEFGDVAVAIDHLNQSWRAPSVGTGYTDPGLPMLSNGWRYEDPVSLEPARLNVRVVATPEGSAP